MKSNWIWPSGIRKAISIFLISSLLFVMQEKSSPVSSYEVYDDVQLDMGVDVDAYVVEDSRGKWFQVARVAYDCGWLGDGAYSSIDQRVEATYTPGVFEHDNGDSQVWLTLDGYHDEIVPGGEDSQLCAIELSYNDGDGEPEQVSVYFDRHFEDDDYRIAGYDWYVSRDDMIVLCYVLWSESENPGENPMESEFGEDYSLVSTDNDAVAFSLP